jgi:hypothetical protein
VGRTCTCTGHRPPGGLAVAGCPRPYAWLDGQRVGQHRVADRQPVGDLDAIERAQPHAHRLLHHAAVRQPPHPPVRARTDDRRGRQRARAFAPRGGDLHRQRHVLAQEGRGCCDLELHLDRAALRVDAGRDAQHPRLEGLLGEGVGDDPRQLSDRKLREKLLVRLPDELRGPGGGECEQRAARLHDLPGLDQARDDAPVGR